MMDIRSLGVAIFVVIVVGVSLWQHSSGRSLVRASLVSGALAALLSQVVLQPLTWAATGHIDPLFASVGLLTGFVYAAAISFCVGFGLRLLGKK